MACKDLEMDYGHAHIAVPELRLKNPQVGTSSFTMAVKNLQAKVERHGLNDSNTIKIVQKQEREYNKLCGMT